MPCLNSASDAAPLNQSESIIFLLEEPAVKSVSYVLLFVTACLFSACGSEAPLDSGAVTPDVQSEMEKEKQEVFDAESAHRAAQAQQGKN